MDALLRGELGADVAVQFIARLDGDDRLAPWVSRWLADVSRDGEEGWGQVVDFAEAPKTHDEQPVVILIGPNVQAMELQLPVLAVDGHDVCTVVFPLRLLSREDSPASFVVWGNPSVRVGDYRTLDERRRQRLRTAVAEADARVWAWLRTTSDPALSPCGANWLYARSVLAGVDTALTDATRAADTLETSLMTGSQEVELLRSLQTLAAIRRSLPIVMGGVRLLSTLPAGSDSSEYRHHPMESALSLSAEIQSRARATEARIRTAGDSLAQVATGVQLERARLDSEQTRVFQRMVAVLASLAVGPGALAAWVQAAKVEITGPALAGLMLLAAALTAAVLLGTLRRRT